MISYDLHPDAIYITLSHRPIARQIEMPDGVIIDVDNVGRAVGIDVYGLSTGWDWKAVVDRFDLHSDARFLQMLAALGGPQASETPNLAREPVAALG
ncbi:MAG: hypothetical protein CL424_14320 [Acidimicrobiaceae bacterium]|nr:hypothetical protein [Acidimicrobiaceae bacterium]